MRTTGGLAELLHAKREIILERWQRRVVADVGGEGVSHVELLDHMPAFLDEVAAMLGSGREGGTETAPEHGRQRLRVGFDVAQVVREYGVLADVVFLVIEEAGALVSPRDVRVLLDCLNAGAADAVRAYVVRRDAEVRRQSAKHRGFIAHELRTPLGGAVMALEVLTRTLPDAERERPVAVLRRSLQQLSELINQVLIEGCLDAGVEPEYGDVDVAALVREVAADALPDAEGRRLRLLVDAPDALPARLDRRLVRSAIANLVRNAIKFTRVGDLVTLALRAEGGEAVVRVEDGCGGFDPAGWLDVFEPFVRGGSERSGFGLGLAIAKQAAEVHGGTIGMRNLPPRGCRFELRLPRAGAEPLTH